MTSLRLLLCVLALSLPFAGSGFAAGTVLGGPQIQQGSGIDIEIRSFYETLPRRGFVPLRITIANSSGKERTWHFSFTSQANYGDATTLNHEVALTVADGEAKQFDVLVPLVRSTSFGRFSGNITGFGIEGGIGRVHLANGYAGHGLPSLAAVAMSEKLSQGSWGVLKNSVTNLSGSPFARSPMPTDWRGFAGFDSIWITDQEWLQAGAVEQLALLDWVALGRTLYVCREENDRTPLPNLRNLTPESPLSRGLGEIRFWPRKGDLLTADSEAQEKIKRELAHGFDINDQLENSYRRATWSLLRSIPELQIRKGLFIGFLLVFATVIGPVNLFVFARSSRRHRLFWTTPAISFGASLAIFLLILIQDGVGGTGHQLAVWHYLPDENKAVFIQEQASRTALLTNREFSVDGPISISPINIRTLASTQTGNYRVGQRSYNGDWFRNRSTQAHLIEGVIATRSRIEAAAPLTAGTAPELISTFPFALESVFYCDQDGNWWHAEDLPPGQKRTFNKVNLDAFTQEWDAFVADSGTVIEDRVSRVSATPGRFYAFSEAGEGTWKTLASIDWQTQKSLHTGPIASPNP